MFHKAPLFSLKYRMIESQKNEGQGIEKRYTTQRKTHTTHNSVIIETYIYFLNKISERKKPSESDCSVGKKHSKIEGGLQVIV